MPGTNIAITGGTIVTASDMYRADVLVHDGKISAIIDDLDLSGGEWTGERIDATGRFIIPGGIDVHTHLSMPFGGTMSCDDFETGHVAALHGGTTCHIDFVIQERGQSLQAALDTWRAKANGAAVMDYGFHMIISDARPEVIAEMPSMVEQGVTSFKLFLAYPGVFMVDDDTLHAVMEQAAGLDALVMMHCENGQVIDRLVKRAIDEGKTAPGWHYRTRPAQLEGESTSRAVALAGLTGAALYVVHVTCDPSVQAIRAGRAAGHRVWGETCTQYFHLTQDDLDRPGFEGAKFVCSPPLRTEADQVSLWEAVNDGTLSVVSTDHCPFTFGEQKQLGKDSFAAIPNGLPGIEERMSILSTGAAEGHITWNRLVELSSTNPAKLFGMYPRKGTIAVGSDADIVVWDPDAAYTWSADRIHGAVDYTCFEGMRVVGKATHVLSRGDIVIADGERTDAAVAGRGEFVHRATFTHDAPHRINAGAANERLTPHIPHHAGAPA